MDYLLKGPREVTSDGVIASYFQIGKPGATQQTPVRISGYTGAFFEYTKSTLWSSGH